MAGRLSEEMFLKKYTNTGADDLKNIKKIASNMVLKYGMAMDGSKLPNIGFPDAELIKKPYS